MSSENTNFNSQCGGNNIQKTAGITDQQTELATQSGPPDRAENTGDCDILEFPERPMADGDRDFGQWNRTAAGSAIDTAAQASRLVMFAGKRLR